jgi:Nif-specific regulatory protein
MALNPLSAINSVSQAMGRFQSLPEMLDYALEKVLEVVETEAGSVYLLDEERGVLTMAASRGLSAEAEHDFDHLRLGEGLSGRVAQEGVPIVLSNLQDDPRLTRMVARSEGFRAFASMPLRSSMKTYGTLNVHTREDRTFTEQDIQLLSSMGAQIGLFVANARLLWELEAAERRLRSLVEQARATASKTVRILPAIHARSNGPSIIGPSEAMQAVLQTVRRVARTDSSVLIVGESGTGKELVAGLLHRESRRRAGPFVPINCGAIPDALVESELFGHGRGAFTGAIADKKGLIEEADGGVLFLDEIGEMPLAVQVKLLRFLEGGEVRRVGCTLTRGVNVRLIAATHCDLADAVDAGRFRRDFYYRINVVTIAIPPLRERRSDIAPLARHFLNRLTAKLVLPSCEFSDAAMDRLCEYSWPGNVRELRNAVEHALNLKTGDTVGETDLPPTITRRPSAPFSVRSFAPDGGRQLVDMLERCHWNHKRAAARLGISRTTLWRRLREYRLDLE